MHVFKMQEETEIPRAWIWTVKHWTVRQMYSPVFNRPTVSIKLYIYMSQSSNIWCDALLHLIFFNFFCQCSAHPVQCCGQVSWSLFQLSLDGRHSIHRTGLQSHGTCIETDSWECSSFLAFVCFISYLVFSWFLFWRQFQSGTDYFDSAHSVSTNNTSRTHWNLWKI